MNKIIILIILLKLCSNQEQKIKKYILLSFSINENNNTPKIFNSDIFIKNYFNKNLLLTFYLGEPPQKIKSIILNDNVCFELRNSNNLSLSKNNIYSPKYSSSFSLFNKQLFFVWRNTKFMTIGYDYISFDKNRNEKYNCSFYFQMTNQENISISDISDKEYIAKISLNKPLYYTSYECPNFINEIKSKANLNKYTFSFEFIDGNKGNLIIGDELFNYNNKKYFKSQYIYDYSNDNYDIYFNDIISYNKNENISFNGTYGRLSFNLGVIIGTREYKQVIDEIFFNKFISDKICQIDNIIYNSTQNYFVYNCNNDKFNIKNFPKIFFVSKNYLYNFELNYSDIFIKSNSKYYFLIIFKANNNKKDIKDSWILGQPFISKYSFTLNVDAKMIGFYNPSLPKDKEEFQINNEKNNNIKKILLILFLIICIFTLLILAFIFGMKMKKEKKKRADELKDNYEYISEIKDKFIIKSNQTIELNSKIIK